MLSHTKKKSLRETAVNWFLRLQKVGMEHPDRSQFESWLMASPLHQEVYAEVEKMWDKLDSTPKLEELTLALQKKNQLQKSSKIKMSMTALGILMLSVFGMYTYQLWQAQPITQMVTTAAFGEIKTQELDDGTKLTMNAKTDIEVIYYRHQRMVKLNSGEAIFEVSKDAGRPFIVDSGNAKITVLGTRFAVNKLKNIVRISVDHGRVQVERAQPSGLDLPAEQMQNNVNNIAEKPIFLTDGQVAEVVINQSPKRVSRPASDAFSFQQGVITFNEAKLEEISETLSRYRTQPVNVQTGTGNQSHITAVVKARNVDKFLNSLPDLAPVSVSFQTDQVLIVDHKK